MARGKERKGNARPPQTRAALDHRKSVGVGVRGGRPQAKSSQVTRPLLLHGQDESYARPHHHNAALLHTRDSAHCSQELECTATAWHQSTVARVLYETAAAPLSAFTASSMLAPGDSIAARSVSPHPGFESSRRRWFSDFQVSCSRNLQRPAYLLHQHSRRHPTLTLHAAD